MQAADPPVMAAPAENPATDTGRLMIDIKAPAAPSECPAGRSNEIVVCGERQDQEQFRLRPLDPRFAGLAPDDGRLRTTIGGVPVEGVSEQANVGGWPSNRIMLRATIKF